MKKLTTIFILTSTAVFVLLGTGIIYLLQREPETVERVVTENIYVNENDEPIEDFTKEEVLNVVSNMLTAFNTDVEGQSRTYAERITALENGDPLASVATEEAISYLHLADLFTQSDEGATATGMILLSVLQLIESSEAGVLAPEFKDMDEAIYLDGVSRTSFVPLDLFVGYNSGFSFELVYVNNEWKFSPYSFVQGVQLSDIVYQSATAQ